MRHIPLLQKRVLLFFVVIILLVLNLSFLNKPKTHVLASEDASDEWPMLLQNPARTGFSTSEAPDSPQLRYIVNYTRRHNDPSSPIFFNGRLIMAGGYSNNSLYAINASTGSLLWTSPLTFLSDATPASDADWVVIPSDDRNLYCINSTDGSLRWTFPIEHGAAKPSPLIVDGVVYYPGVTYYSDLMKGQNKGYLYAISLTEMENDTTPRLIWKTFLNCSHVTPPAYNDNRIFLAYSPYESGIGYYACLNATDGTYIWKHETGFGFDRTPFTVDDGRLFYRGSFCFNETTGEMLWDTRGKVSGRFGTSPAIANGRLYAGTIGDYRDDPYFYCLNASNGEVMWEHLLDENCFSSPAVA
jgi:outer membrane protein assembly factor BamB